MVHALFPFSRERSRAFGMIARPVAKVTLRTIIGKPFDISAIVDSGADISMFSPSIAKIIGLKIEDGDRKLFKGLGGNVEAYVHAIPLRLGMISLEVRVAFPKIEIPNILGRIDILNRCNLHFIDESKVCFEQI